MKSKLITSYVIKSQDGHIIDVVVGTTPRKELNKLKAKGCSIKKAKLSREEAEALRNS